MSYALILSLNLLIVNALRDNLPFINVGHFFCSIVSHLYHFCLFILICLDDSLSGSFVSIVQTMSCSRYIKLQGRCERQLSCGNMQEYDLCFQ